MPPVTVDHLIVGLVFVKSDVGKFLE